MSGPSNINNSFYKFELALVNTKSGEEIYLPIPKGAVEYLEVEDSLANFGLIGLCKISNFYNILQQLKVMDVTGINCMYISIKNMDFDKISDSSKTSIDFFSLITKNTETSKNIIDKTVNFEFEDYFIARTRMESIIGFIDKLDGKKTEDIPGKLIYDLFKLCNEESVSDLNVTEEIFNDNLFMLDGLAPFKVSLSNFYDGDKVKSIYDLIMELYKYCSYSAHGPALISTTNIIKNNEVKRKITLQPFSNYTAGFYELYQQGVSDLSKYVTEEFIIGDSSSSSALNTNFIDSFNFIRVDQDDVLANKWIDYIISSSANLDLTKTDISSVLYSTIKSEFSQQLLAGLPANLPERGINEKINTQVVHKKIGNDNILTNIYIENTLKKSFIYDNTAITFSVQGNTYREAGKFIRINSEDLKDKSSGSETKSVDGYWFILSVKHIFKGDFYTNEYVCVRLHTNDAAKPTQLSDLLQPNFEDSVLLETFNTNTTIQSQAAGAPELPVKGEGEIEGSLFFDGPPIPPIKLL